MANDDAIPRPADGREPGTGRFKPGQSGNPKGRPKSLVALEAEIRELHGARALGVLEKLAALAEAGDTAAAKLYLDRVLGPARTPPAVRPHPEAHTVTPDARSLADRLRALIAGQLAAQEEQARAEGLTDADVTTLATLARALATLAGEAPEGRAFGQMSTAELRELARKLLDDTANTGPSTGKPSP